MIFLRLLLSNILPGLFLAITIYIRAGADRSDTLRIALSSACMIIFALIFLRQVILLNKYGLDWLNKASKQKESTVKGWMYGAVIVSLAVINLGFFLFLK